MIWIAGHENERKKQVGQNGKPEKYLAIRAVITERKKMDEVLRDKTSRLERFQNLTVGRELEMVKLKEEINSLLEQLGQPKRYEAPGQVKKVRAA